MFWKLFIVAAIMTLAPPLAVPQDVATTTSYLDPDTIPQVLEFLTAYNKQWPFRRLTFVYSLAFIKDSSREETRNETAGDEFQTAIVDRLFARTFSALGVSTSSIYLPLKAGEKVVQKLNLNETDVAPVTLVLFSLDGHYATFVRQVAEADGMSFRKLWWIIISNNITNLQLNLDLGVRSDSRILVASSVGPSSLAISRWSGSGVVDIHTWEGIPNPLDLQDAPKGLLDLEGQKLSVAVFQDYPFVFADQNGNLSGWCVDIWNEIQEKLKFKTTYYILPSASIHGLFKRATEELWLGRADAVIGAFAMTHVDEVDFSEPVNTLRYRFYLQRSTVSSSWTQFIQPFTMTMWISTCLTLVILCISMAILYAIGRHVGIERQDGAPIYNFKESVLIAFGALMQQGPDYLPEGIGANILLWFNYVFGLVVYTAYSAALISKLTIRTVDPPFKSLNDFIDDKSYTPYMLPDSAPYRLSQSAEHGAWRELRERRPEIVVIPTLEQGIQKAAYNARATLLAARERVGFFVQQSPLNCRLAQIPVDIAQTPGRFLFQKNSPFKAAIDQQLLQMSTSGRLIRWRERWMGMVKDNPCPPDATLPKFGLEQVTLPFGILAAGMAISFFLLAMEFLLKRLFPHTHNTTHAIHTKTMDNLTQKVREEKSAIRKRKAKRKMSTLVGPAPVEFLH